MIDELPLFLTDYLIAWEVVGDCPRIRMIRLRQDGPDVLAESIGQVSADCGCLSLRQVLELHEANERNRQKTKEEGNHEQTRDS